MAQRGRPRSKPMKKWNPRYSKTSVRVAIQNTLMDNPDLSMILNTDKFIKSILQQCDEWALEDGQSPPE
jgi:hypothetical protein|tara:strand:- start:439 stop:645 length:207 start_codon:yes stop_codon:yes gene_type:complete